MSAIVSKVIEHFRSQPDVWLTTHEEVAGWFTGLGIDHIPVQDRF
jgi:hypothetical protein